MRRYRETGQVADRPRSGRRRCTTPAEDRHIRLQALRERSVPANRIQANIHRQRRNGQQGVSVQTIRNRLHDQGLRSRKPAMKPKLTVRHKLARIRWARAHERCTHAQWTNIIFTDESRFLLYGNDGRQRVWRRTGERYADCNVQPRCQAGGGGLMVWGGISVRGKSNLVFVDGNLNSRRYIDQILTPVVVPYMQARPNMTLMDDNAPAHRARLVAAFHLHHNIDRMDPWPACSPDLNPLENCWDQIGRAVRARVVQGDTVRNLRGYLQDAWDALTPLRINRLIRSMRRRCQAVIAAHGGVTRY